MTKELSLSDRITSYLLAWKKLDSEKFISGGEIERLALDAGYKSSNASRRCRELAEEGILEAKYDDKGHVAYKFNW